MNSIDETKGFKLKAVFNSIPIFKFPSGHPTLKIKNYFICYFPFKIFKFKFKMGFNIEPPDM